MSSSGLMPAALRPKVVRMTFGVIHNTRRKIDDALALARLPGQVEILELGLEIDGPVATSEQEASCAVACSRVMARNRVDVPEQ